jgi:4-hydroxybenzoyl-CoA thioesterase
MTGTARPWRTQRSVCFAHCDPAGIVFYPRLFEIVHDAKEEFFGTVLGQPFRELFRSLNRGLPMVRLETDMLAPARHGDVLDSAIDVSRLYVMTREGEARLNGRTVVVHTGLDTGRPVPIDGPLRSALERFMNGNLPLESHR